MIESFDKKKIPLRQVQTEERQRLRIKQFSKIPGEFCDISELFDVKKMYAKGKSTGGLIQVLLASPSPSPPSKGFINKKNNNSPNGGKKKNNKKIQIPMERISDLKLDSENIESTKANTTKIKVTERDISEQEEFEIKKVFRKMFLFEGFPEDILDIILGSLFLIKIFKGDFLYQKGSSNSCFYIVLNGALTEIDENQNIIKQYKSWDCFGHQSLMLRDHIDKIENSIKAEADSQLFVLNGDTFLTIKQKLINFKFEERYEFLNTIIFFKTLDCIARHSVAEKMKLITFTKGQQIIKKDNDDKSIYLIKQGKVSCVTNGKECKLLGVSNYVGIISIIMRSKRTMDVFAKEDTICFMLTDQDLSDALGENYVDAILQFIFREYIYANSTFSDLINDSNINDVFSKFKLVKYAKQEKIHEKNKNRKRIILLLEGNFVNISTMKIAFDSGSIIGEETLTNNVDISSNLMAFPDCLTLEANLFDISDFLGEEFRSSTINLIHRVLKLKKIRFFSLMSENTLKMIVDSVKKEKFFPEQHIIEEGSNGQKFYVISKGIVSITKGDTQIRQLEKDSFFGEIALLSKDNKRTRTVIAVNNVTCYVINKKNFSILIQDKGIFNILEKRISLQDDSIDITDLKMIIPLGKGKFGSVSLVHNNRNVYAIKAISRKDADIKKRIASYLIMERRIMLSLDHPFITKIVKTFKNENFVFLLLEFVNGICLKELLNSQVKVFNMNDTRFYISSLLLVIDYLHHKGIAHRDMKANNIMIDGNGYIKLIDFGTAKFIKDYTNTIIGTPHYMAPEVLSGKGYSFSCDYWSIGVIAFEIFYHKYPFGAEATEAMEIYNDIMYSNFKFPFKNDMFEKLNHFIEAMLTKNVNKRPCSLVKIKQMELFENVNFNDLLEMKAKPPFIPSVINFSDFNFDSYQQQYQELPEKDLSLHLLSKNKNEKVINAEWANEFE